jgi:predicted Fe-Mo cluster-binding NifX family protein
MQLLKRKNKQEETLMKIAVASEGRNVSQHFGHCANFNVFDTENGMITGSMTIKNGDHEHGCVPDFLTASGVRLVITGGIGGGAVSKLNGIGIDVIMGASGDAAQAVEAYLSGSLTSTGALCADHGNGHGHGHGGHCGHDHHDGQHQCRHGG